MLWLELWWLQMEFFSRTSKLKLLLVPLLTQAFSPRLMAMIQTFLLCRMASNQKFLHAVSVMQLMQTPSTRTRL